MSNEMKKYKKPSFVFALALLITIIAMIILPNVIYGVSLQPMFFLSWLVAVPACMVLGYSYMELQDAVIDYANKALVSVFIVLAVGALIGTWNASGTVPGIIYIGLKLISPRFFLITAFLLSSATSLSTGTSWGTLGTAGVALSAIGLGLGINPGMTAGSVVSGAFVGDMFSPLSDSSNLAAAVTNVDIFAYIKHLAKVAIPAFIISAILFLVVGYNSGSGNADYTLINETISIIETNYKITLITFLPAIFVIVLLVLQKPAIISILTGAVTGGVIAMVYQGMSFANIITYIWSGFSIETGSNFVDQLLNRGGIESMFGTASLFLFSFGLMGILNKAGILDSVVAPLTKRIKTRTGLVGATVGISVLGDSIGGSSSFSYLFGGNIMLPLFKNAKVKTINLTRALGCTCTPVAALIPWNINAVLAASFLGVTAFEYARYTFFAYITPILVLLYAVFNINTPMEEPEIGENISGKGGQ